MAHAVNVRPMLDFAALIIAAVFLLAGLVKGVLGLGLPTISMGLLAIAMPPGQAAAMLVVPSLATNFWQMVGGPYLRGLLKRLAGMLAGVCIGTWLGAGWLTGPYARFGAIALGLSLIVYAVLGLSAVRFKVPHDKEAWLGPIVGLLTGLITAATGVFVIPAIVYLQGIGLEKEELVQALGLSFTISTVALSFNLIGAGVLNVSLAATAIIALVAALAGMWIGQVVRLRLEQATFRRWFFIGLLLLGIYLIAAPLVR
ncbi:sulfite exporter TauE/SafE family protein [Bradyrhizobium sp. LHD-71]|uniref:sulfite exporter TauE/SafE family protein n=1 Tax=Bradyrhizobium sp. LHD-71 TaxID=3072141 RepID=UPI00280E9137|nr:sulfite exporter TauE/SafE family protein [Bradyrhizobium sp. LHD-71]MDQ8726852.1 sulfite exporter TauE/SafE family protein [Bradyrhizobium sp. LHD-71]